MTARDGRRWKGRQHPDDLIRGMGLDPATAAALADHVNDLLMRECTAATVEARLKVLRLLARYLAPATLLDATPLQLRRWQRSLVTLSVESRRAYTVHVRGFYRWARTDELIDADPAADLAVPKVQRGRPRPMPEGDLQAALQAATPQVRVWLVLGSGAGLRAMEVAGLERADVVDTAQVPHLIIRGKGGKERRVPLSPWVLAELQAYGMPAAGPLFLVDGLPVTPLMVSRITNRYLHKAGIRFTFHKCRHRFATQLYKVTRDMLLVQETLGHESLDTTRRYTDYDSSRTAAAVASLTVAGAA